MYYVNSRRMLIKVSYLEYPRTANVWVCGLDKLDAPECTFSEILIDPEGSFSL